MAQDPPPSAKLTRPRFPRMIAGVCSGFALHYGWDVSLVRVTLVVVTIFSGGCGLLAYLAAWIIIPEAPYSLPPTASTATTTSPNPTTGSPNV